MKPYHTPNGAPLTGLALAVVATIIGGGIIGIASSFIGQQVYLIGLFPLLMGIAGGVALTWAVQKGRVHGVLMGALFGLLMAAAIYAGYHYTDYRSFLTAARADVREQVQKEGVAADEALVDAVIDLILEDRTRSAGFLGYLKLTAAEGLTISSVVPKAEERPWSLTGGWVWLYWLGEFLLITVLAGYLGGQSAKAPYCTNCQQWYPGGKYVGSVAALSSASFLSLVRSQSFARAGEMIDWQEIPDASLDVYLHRCSPVQTCDVLLSVRGPVADDKGRVVVRDVLEELISRRAALDLTADVKARREAAEAAEDADSEESEAEDEETGEEDDAEEDEIDDGEDSGADPNGGEIADSDRSYSTGNDRPG